MDALEVEATILVSQTSNDCAHFANAYSYVACDFAALVPRSRPASDSRSEACYQGVESERPIVA